MKDIFYEEEGVASAVGTIFAILIFVSLLSIFVSTYVPATMMADEEQYSSSIMNSMVQLASAINQMALNPKPGEVSLIPFDLESGYVPIFSSPTFGYINISSNSPNQEGYLILKINSTPNEIFTAGGAIMAFTDNRYFTDEAWSYEVSSLFYFNPNIKDQGNSSLISNFIRISPNTNGMDNVSIFLVNIVGGPNTISTSSPVAISVSLLTEQTYFVTGNNISLQFTSFMLNEAIKGSIEQSLNLGGNFNIISSTSSPGNYFIKESSSSVFSVYITELTVMVGMSTYTT